MLPSPEHATLLQLRLQSAGVSTARRAWHGWQRLAANAKAASRAPTFQVLLAVAGMLAGAAVVGRVMFGVTLMVGSGLVAVDGLLRHAPDAAERDQPSLPEPIERWRRAR